VKTASGRQVVVALGAVEPDLVADHLPPGAEFVPAPGPDDLHAAAGAIVRADALVDTLHLPLTPQTRHMVDAEFLAGMPAGSILVNCGRGGLLDLNAAAQALADGRLAGLGLDVFDPEPPTHHPVFDRPDVVLSPHLMGLSVGATRATFTAAAQGVADVLAGLRPAALANPEWDFPDGLVPGQEEQ